MGGLIPENIIEQIRENADIVEIASGYLNLKKAGRNYKALCPFHVEKTPSFIVNPEKQIFHCFGCGVGGNVFNLVMKMDNVTFVESVKLLAQKMGMTITFSEEESRETKEKEEICKINEEAAQLYHFCLGNEVAKGARDYLYSRKLSDETIKKFKIGYAPGGKFLIRELLARFKVDSLRRAGLVAFREAGGEPQDYFRQRITFPICNLQDRIIGFGARVLDDTQPKYLNTAETPVFSKGRILYGLNVAREGIRKKDETVIVKGYLDFLTLFQNGAENAVASLGTALTEIQISVLRRYTEKVIMCYDADAAGEEATLRGLELLIEKELEPRIVVLTSGDPDSFVRENGIKAFLKKVEQALPLIDYYFHHFFSKYDLNSTEGKVKISAELFPVLAKVKNVVQRGIYLKKLAQELRLDEKVIYAEFERVSKGKKGEPKQRTARDVRIPKEENRAEAILLKLMLNDCSLVPIIRENLEAGDFKNPNYQKILSGIFDICKKYDIIDIKALIDFLGNEELTSIVSSFSLGSDAEYENKEKVVRDCIKRIKELSMADKKRKIEEEIKKAEKEGKAEQLDFLLNKYQELEQISRKNI